MDEVIIMRWESPRFLSPMGHGSLEDVHLAKNTACMSVDVSGSELGTETKGSFPLL